jgi:hypothetical protein
MARVVDITGRIKTEEVFLTFDGKQYKVNDSKNAMFAAMEAVQNAEKDTDGIDEALIILLGEKAVSELTEDITWAGYQALFTSVMAEVMQIPYEDAEARFQSAAAQQ